LIYSFFWGGISPTLGGYITNIFSFVGKFVDKINVGGISPTLGGYITNTWGVYHQHLGGISPTETLQTHLENTGFLSTFLPLKLY